MSGMDGRERRDAAYTTHALTLLQAHFGKQEPSFASPEKKNNTTNSCFYYGAKNIFKGLIYILLIN